MAQKTSKVNIQPLYDRVLVKPFEESQLEKKTDAGIIIPETAKEERPQQGEVIAVGEGKYVEGEIRTPQVKKGDKIIFSKYGYDEVKVGDDEYYLLKEENILAIITS